MMRTLFIALVLVAVGLGAVGQVKEPVTGLPYLDNGRTDSLVKRYVDIPLSRNYYVFTYPTAMAATAAAVYVSAGYKDLTDNDIWKCDEDILFVFNNAGGFKKSYFPRFFTEVFRFPDEDIKRIKYTVNDTLWSKLENSFLSKIPKLIYVHQGRLLYKQNAKWHRLDSSMVHHDEFVIEPLEPVIIKEDTFRVRAYDGLSAYKKGKLLISTDLRDCVLELDVETGTITNSFCTEVYDPTDFYCNYIAKDDSLKCAEARQYNERFIKLNRQMIDMMMIQPDEKGNIYSVASVEAAEVLEEDYDGYDDEGKYRVFKKGEPFLSAWYVTLIIGPDFKIKEVYHWVDTYGNEKEDEEKYAAYDCGLLINDDGSVITGNGPIIEDWDSATTPLNMFSEYKLQNDTFRFDRHFPYKVSKKLFPRAQAGWNATYFFRFRGKALAMIDGDNHIYSMDSDEPVDSVSGDGTPPYVESFPKYIEDTVKFKLNYIVCSVSPVLGGSHLAIIYTYKNKLMMEIKDAALKTVYASDFTHVPGFGRFYEKRYARTWHKYLPIQDDTIYFMALEDEEYKLFSYSIKKACIE